MTTRRPARRRDSDHARRRRTYHPRLPTGPRRAASAIRSPPGPQSSDAAHRRKAPDPPGSPRARGRQRASGAGLQHPLPHAGHRRMARGRRAQAVSSRCRWSSSPSSSNARPSTPAIRCSCSKTTSSPIRAWPSCARASSGSSCRSSTPKKASSTHISSRCERRIEAVQGWSFHPEIHLGLFSFSKLLMYRDLDPAKLAGTRPPRPITR